MAADGAEPKAGNDEGAVALFLRSLVFGTLTLDLRPGLLNDGFRGDGVRLQKNLRDSAICTIPEDGKDSLYLITAKTVGGHFPYNCTYLRLSQRNVKSADLVLLDAAVRFDATSTELQGGGHKLIRLV